MLKKVLIANRGEIAVRVIRACKEMGLQTVAVYSDLDRDALHVRLADEAYALDGSTATETYLDTDKILDIIERSGADAVHPGYGFFSENTDFAGAISSRGVTFVGPPASAITVMGDKVSSRKAAQAAGVVGVPGTTEFLTDASEVVEFGDSHGWPLAIKAAYGGGGRGMRVVERPDQAADAFESAKSESLKGFGREECYVERYLTWPRHIEMQIIADTHGNCVWLGERDCSSQRRHQKLIEESPAADFPDEVRRAMGEAAVKVAQACGYVNAGTVEFLYQDDEFFFLEMNTRLQVEHPVTELVSGIDLVREQLRVAAGEPLSFTQDDIDTRGHAIEVRVNAESVAGGKFLPSPGTIGELIPPQGFGIRWDGGYESNDEVSQFYDNLVGKLIVWGSDRPTAISRMLRALEEFRISGIPTTIPAAQAILSHSDFAEAKHSTKWVEDVLDLSEVGVEPVSTAEDDGEEKVRRDVDVEVNGRKYSVSMWLPETPAVAATASGLTPAPRRRSSSRATASAGEGSVAVPMQGTITKVSVEVGDEVTQGDTVCVLEAMKMENNVAADKTGKVSEVRCEVGQTVNAGDVVVIIK